MKTLTRLIAATAIALIAGNSAFAEGGHNHDMLDQLRYGSANIDKLEWRNDDGDSSTAWEAEAYYGDSLQRIGIETDGERSDSTTERADAELLYRRAIAPFWDLKLGWRHDFQPGPQRDWLAVGIDGLVPYGIDSEAMLYVGDEGHTLLDLKLGYELLLTQRLSIEPEIELRAASEADEDTEMDSGLNSIEVSLRLHYAVTRKFTPYIGVVWERAYGNSLPAGDDSSQTRAVAGLRFWL